MMVTLSWSIFFSLCYLVEVSFKGVCLLKNDTPFFNADLSKTFYFIHEYACLRLNIPPIFVRNLRKTRTTVGTCSTVARSTVVLPKVAIGIYILGLCNDWPFRSKTSIFVNSITLFWANFKKKEAVPLSWATGCSGKNVISSKDV